jgi:hypothetical protein
VKSGIGVKAFRSFPDCASLHPGYRANLDEPGRHSRIYLTKVGL